MISNYVQKLEFEFKEIYKKNVSCVEELCLSLCNIKWLPEFTDDWLLRSVLKLSGGTGISLGSGDSFIFCNNRLKRKAWSYFFVYIFVNFYRICCIIIFKKEGFTNHK